MEKKIRQHYVWQRYLKNWSKDQSQIYCLRDNRIFITGTTCLALERYFYKLDGITPNDLDLIKRGYVDTMKGVAQEHAQKILHIFSAMVTMRDALLARFPNNVEVSESLDVFFTNVEENYHAEIEGHSTLFLDSLINRQTGFYNDPEKNAEFNIFLTTQYVRTKNMQDALLSKAAEHPYLYEPTRRAMSVYRFITAHTIAMGLSKHMDWCSFKLLNNNTDTPFITGDQPVINTKADDIDLTTGFANSLELYYPISPEIAVLINPNFGTNQHQEVQVTNDEAKEYNDKMFNASHEQIFAKEEVHLLPYKDT
mgnify:CR=1 FL=1